MIKLTNTPVLYTYDLTNNEAPDLAAELVEFLKKAKGDDKWSLHNDKQILIHVSAASKSEREGDPLATELLGILSKYIGDDLVTVEYVLLTFVTP